MAQAKIYEIYWLIFILSYNKFNHFENMSYVADHLAWQQRVHQEYKAQSSSTDTGAVFEQNG